jgi:hypothetical protein
MNETDPETMAMSDAELSAIGTRCAAATQGPWRAFIEGRDHDSGSDFIRTGEGASRGEDIELSGASPADYDFIAHARQDIPKLLHEIARLKSIKEREEGARG